MSSQITATFDPTRNKMPVNRLTKKAEKNKRPADLKMKKKKERQKLSTWNISEARTTTIHKTQSGI